MDTRGGGEGYPVKGKRETNDRVRCVKRVVESAAFEKDFRVGFVRSSLFGLSSVNGGETVTLSLRELETLKAKRILLSCISCTLVCDVTYVTITVARIVLVLGTYL